jgi:phosphatidylglycerophosphate synthase
VVQKLPEHHLVSRSSIHPPQSTIHRLSLSTVLRGVRDYMRSPPNFFTGMRLASIPVLWVLAFMERPRALGIGVAFAFATDMIDGYLARRLKAQTEIGSRTDSLADHLLAASTVAWLFVLRPEFFRAHGPLLAAWIFLALITLLVAWVRFRRFVDLHLYSAKLAVFSAYTMAVALLVTGRHAEWHWALAFGAACFAAVEALYVMLTRRDADEHTISVFLRRRG